MAKFIVTADSTMDMPVPQADALGIKIIPSYFHVGEEMLYDFPDWTYRELFERGKDLKLTFKTSAASPDEYARFFEPLVKDGTQVLHIAKGAELSCCYQNACLAAEDVGNVTVYDSTRVSAGSAILAEAAALHAEEPVEEVVKLLDQIRDRIRGGFIIDTLDYMARGGRCTTLAALGANILHLRPSIVLKDGKMLLDKKYRGNYRKCLKDYFTDMLADREHIDPSRVWLIHSMVHDDLLDYAVNLVKETGFFKETELWIANPALAVHSGPDMISMFYLMKE